jgi:hypothetical protein
MAPSRHENVKHLTEGREHPAPLQRDTGEELVIETITERRTVMAITILNVLQRAIFTLLLILSIAACTDQGLSPQQSVRTESPGFIDFGG